MQSNLALNAPSSPASVPQCWDEGYAAPRLAHSLRARQSRGSPSWITTATATPFILGAFPAGLHPRASALAGLTASHNEMHYGKVGWVIQGH